MSEMIVVNGEECLNYINKPLGLANIRDTWSDQQIIGADTPGDGVFNLRVSAEVGDNRLRNRPNVVTPYLYQVEHDINKRICGFVTDNYSDGGKRVVIMGNERISLTGLKGIALSVGFSGNMMYEVPLGGEVRKKPYNFNPQIGEAVAHSSSDCGCNGWVRDEWAGFSDMYASFDDTLDYNPRWHNNISIEDVGETQTQLFSYQGGDFDGQPVLTTDKNNTLVYGEAVLQNNMIYLYGGADSDNPLDCIAGNLYFYLSSVSNSFNGLCPDSFLSPAYLDQWTAQAGFNAFTFNGICVPYNLILTNSEQSAIAYVENGTLPPDAYLFPLDFDNLPKYDETVPTGDKPDDFPDDNDPDDDDRDFDPTPPETPSFTVNQLTNYNWYWLTVPEWSAFISWFWNDIGDYSDFDDIIAKVKGLYNDVASAVIMCRYYPVDISWIGGLGTQSNIKLGMIEKEGAVDTISQLNALHAVDIGHVHIGTKYKSFMDMSPYSQLSLYLPWHGFIDLDMNLFNGHDVYVKALYDYLSGTIQYYIYYDNELLVNTILCKMAMDIPITLQTKNDRDSAIFNNVSSTIGGLVGAGAGIISGNPIGMALGVTQGVGAFNSANASAPMRLMGNVGESGAYIGCQNCFVVVRRPTIQPSDGNSTTMKGLSTWKKNVGMLCGYGYTLSDLSGQGFTVCHSPRIDFKSTTPLQTEVDEIYSYLEKGVIL